eukprot:15180-Heterococcus_DN1.PRE.3
MQRCMGAPAIAQSGCRGYCALPKFKYKQFDTYTQREREGGLVRSGSCGGVSCAALLPCGSERHSTVRAVSLPMRTALTARRCLQVAAKQPHSSSQSEWLSAITSSSVHRLHSTSEAAHIYYSKLLYLDASHQRVDSPKSILSLALLGIHVQYDACMQYIIIIIISSSVSNVSWCRHSAAAVAAPPCSNSNSVLGAQLNGSTTTCETQPSDSCAGFNAVYGTNSTRITASTVVYADTSTDAPPQQHAQHYSAASIVVTI